MSYFLTIRNSVAKLSALMLLLALSGAFARPTASFSLLTPALPFQSDSLECHLGDGGQLFAAGGQVEVEIRTAEADTTDDIYLFRRDQQPLLIASNKEPRLPKVVHLGAIPAGTELQFGIKVRETGFTFRMGSASRNPDGLIHAKVACKTGLIAEVYFEDIYGGGDNDFDDAVIQVRISRKRGIQEDIYWTESCPPVANIIPQWGHFGQKRVLESDAGEKLELRCQNVSNLPSYTLLYTPPRGRQFRVGLCPFKGGKNSGFFIYSGDVDRNNKPDSFVLTRWQSRDFWSNDIPNPWTHERDENTLDHAISIYDVFLNNLSKYDDKYEYLTPPPPENCDPKVCAQPTQGRFLKRIRLADPPLGRETEAFFDEVARRMQEVPSSTMPMSHYPYSAADLNADGVLDPSDIQVFQDAVGRCDGEPDFNPLADFDGDDCVTALDEDIFLDLFVGLHGNRRPRAEGKNIVVAADNSCTASINPSDVNDGSFDPDADLITLALDSAGPLPLGEHLVTLTVTDSHGASSSFTTTVMVVSGPTITDMLGDKTQLWPPNHNMVPVTVNYSVANNCESGPATCTLSITSNEPVNGTGDGDTAPDWEIIDAHHVRLRSERAGNGRGRIYTIKVTCTDSLGNSFTKNVTVTVPKSQGGG